MQKVIQTNNPKALITAAIFPGYTAHKDKYNNGYPLLIFLLENNIHRCNYDEMIKFLATKDLIEISTREFHIPFTCRQIPIAISSKSLFETTKKLSQSRQFVTTISFYMAVTYDFTELSNLIASTFTDGIDPFCIAYQCDIGYPQAPSLTITKSRSLNLVYFLTS
jgi:hypothetical protein